MDAKILPLAIAMMAGPQILSAIVFVTGSRPIKSSLAYLFGIFLAISVGIGVARGLSHYLNKIVELSSSGSQTPAGQAIELGLVALLIVLAIRSFLNRKHSKPPKWMHSLQDAKPQAAFRLGVLLIFLMPTDLIIMLTIGVHLAGHKLSTLAAVPFVGLTMLIAAAPLLFYLLLGKHGAPTMERVRGWMDRNSWAVNIAVYALFIFLILN